MIISAFALVTFASTVAYAALSQQLLISGNINKKGGTWNIYLSNPTVYQTTGSAVSEDLELVDATTLSISASLTEPGDSVTYTFTVNNGGTLNAQLYSYGLENASEFTALANQYNISYTLTYSDGSALSPGTDFLLSKQSVVMKLTFRYNGTQALTDDDVFLSMRMKLMYIQKSPASL